jgi:signal transduction histidine kinase
LLDEHAMAKWARLAQSPGISVDRRLTLLVLSQLATAALLIGVAVVTLERLASERDYMDRYVFAPLVDIGQALGAAAELHDQLGRPPGEAATGVRGPTLRLQAFIERYQRDWETGKSDLPEAARLRAELERQGESRLLEEEHEVVGEGVEALRAIASTTGPDRPEPLLRIADVSMLDRALGRLNLINLRYVQIAYKAFERTHRQVTAFFFVISAASVLGATLLGLAVRRAIGPRVRHLVESVRRFRDAGDVGAMDARGDDDLGVLAATLELCFRSIATRDAEREHFLAIAAHELKTPLTTLKGFAQVALAHAAEPAMSQRALAVIDRQATRLTRLVQDLLWCARADAGRLPFNPAPLDLEALARRVVSEIEMVCQGHEVRFVAAESPRLLADAALLEQALWNLLVQAVTVAPEGDPVRMTIDGTATHARVSVEARSDLPLPDDLDELAECFAALPFERRSEGLRSTALGLHLVRVIARLHGAGFYLERKPGGVFLAVLDLRR